MAVLITGALLADSSFVVDTYSANPQRLVQVTLAVRIQTEPVDQAPKIDVCR